jgi:hypothetical protein
MVGFMHHYFSSHEKQNNIDPMGCEQKGIKLKGCRGATVVCKRGVQNMTSKLGIYVLEAYVFGAPTYAWELVWRYLGLDIYSNNVGV